MSPTPSSSRKQRGRRSSSNSAVSLRALGVSERVREDETVHIFGRTHSGLLPAARVAEAPLEGGLTTSEAPRLADTQETNGTEGVEHEVTGNQQSLNMKTKDEYPNSINNIQRVQIEPERTGWARLADIVRLKHTEKVADMKEDIDTLLVFAGLFSAVITAFIIESYKNLQQQPEDMIVQILSQISGQLAGNFVNSTVPPPPPFRRPRFTVPINTLWTLSLVIALITASFGILVKQWFHEYLARDKHDPKEQIKIQFYRDAGVKRWRVFEIAAFLPLLLQLALLLFFAGLGLLLHDLDTTVGWITTGLMIAWLALFLSTTAMPMFSVQCPYKTPMLKKFLSTFRSLWVSQPARILARIWPNLQMIHNDSDWRYDLPILDIYYLAPINWKERVYLAARRWRDSWEAYEEDKVCKDEFLDVPVVLCAMDILQGENVTETTPQYFQDLHNIWHLVYLFGNFVRRHDHLERGFISSMPEDQIVKAQELFGTLLAQKPLLKQVIEGCNCDVSLTSHLYQELSTLTCKTYLPFMGYPLSQPMEFAFIQLIQANRTSAAFSFLIMYSIQHRCLTDYPDVMLQISQEHFQVETGLRGIGDQFLSNLLIATKVLLHAIWKQPQHELGDEKIEIIIEAIQARVEESDPVRSPNILAFICVFAMVLRDVLPLDVVQRHRDGICEVMDEFAGIITEFDGSAWPVSHRECVRWAYRVFKSLELEHVHVSSKLRALGRTLSLSPFDMIPPDVDFELHPPIYSC